MTIVMFMFALVFDLIAIIPFLGLLTNPVWGFILYMVYGVNSKSGNYGMKMAGGAILGFIINLLGDFTLVLSWLPTNIGQLIYVLILEKIEHQDKDGGGEAPAKPPAKPSVGKA